MSQERGQNERKHIHVRTQKDVTYMPLLRLILAFLPLAQQVSSFGPLSIHPIYSTNGNYLAQSRESQKKACAFPLAAAPEGALSDIVIPSVFTGGVFANANINTDDDEEDPRVWVPQTDCLSFRPLCFCVSQGYYVNLLKFKGGGVLGCHRHPSPVHALTLKGSWGYKEHDWHAEEGTYVFEPPGETHTLIVDNDCDEMVAMFHGE
jgi:quercetin dioxygenase-like cupin family protein